MQEALYFAIAAKIVSTMRVHEQKKEAISRVKRNASQRNWTYVRMNYFYCTAVIFMKWD